MKFGWIILILLLFSSLATAQITVNQGQNTLNEENTNTEQLIIVQRLALIEAKINSLPTAEQINQTIGLQSQAIISALSASSTDLIVLLLIVTVMQTGLIFGILFYLKAQGKF